jgi:hypothetical protein
MSAKILLRSIHPIPSNLVPTSPQRARIPYHKKLPPLPCARIAAAPTSPVLRLRHCRPASRLPPPCQVRNLPAAPPIQLQAAAADGEWQCYTIFFSILAFFNKYLRNETGQFFFKSGPFESHQSVRRDLRRSHAILNYATLV